MSNHLDVIENNLVKFKLPVYPNATYGQILSGLKKYLKRNIQIKIVLDGKKFEGTEIGVFKKGLIYVSEVSNKIVFPVFIENQLVYNLPVYIGTSYSDLKNYLQFSFSTYQSKIYLNEKEFVSGKVVNGEGKIFLSVFVVSALPSVPSVSKRKNQTKLTKDVLQYMAMGMDYDQILNLCLTHKDYNQKLCKNKYFWKQKIKQDFGKDIGLNESTMKKYDQYRKNRRATLYLVKITHEDEELIEKDGITGMTTEMLLKKYPEIVNKIKRGDMIENLYQSGYRSSGVYFWDGENVIEQNYDYDDYGTPPKTIGAINEFPFDYWKKDEYMKIDDSFEKGESEFRWHTYPFLFYFSYEPEKYEYKTHKLSTNIGVLLLLENKEAIFFEEDTKPYSQWIYADDIIKLAVEEAAKIGYEVVGSAV